MRPFEYSQPTQVIFGERTALRAGSFAAVFGRRALVVCGDLSARGNGSLADVENALGEARVEYELLEGVPPNPGTSVVDAGAALARNGGFDVIVGVGGGSVIDVAKAIAVSALSRMPFRRYLSGIRDPGVIVEATLPVVAVPTLLGSGSETNGTSVIIDEATGRKLSAHSELAAPRVALIDPSYCASAPARLLSAGLADALCHAIEAGLSTRSSVASDALAEAAIAILRRDAVAAAGGESDALGRCMWASNLAGQALSLAGSILTHPLAHPLSARLDASHGEAVAALEPVVIAQLVDRWGQEAVRVSGWFGGRASEPRSAARSLLRRLAEWNAAVGVHTSVADLGLQRDHVATVVDDARASGSRGLVSLPGGELSDKELVTILERALEERPDHPPAISRASAGQA